MPGSTWQRIQVHAALLDTQHYAQRAQRATTLNLLLHFLSQVPHLTADDITRELWQLSEEQEQE